MISEGWKTTGGTDPKPFLIHDSGEDIDRMLVFASETGHLASADTWHMDGTFDSAPLLFHQLFVIRAKLGDSAISCVYALIPNKMQAAYEKLLIVVIDTCTEFGFQPDLDPH